MGTRFHDSAEGARITATIFKYAFSRKPIENFSPSRVSSRVHIFLPDMCVSLFLPTKEYEFLFFFYFPFSFTKKGKPIPAAAAASYPLTLHETPHELGRRKFENVIVQPTCQISIPTRGICYVEKREFVREANDRFENKRLIDNLVSNRDRRTRR